MPREHNVKTGGRVVSPPNSLTVFHVLFTPVVVALLITRADSLAAALFVITAGPTRLGQVLDPVAERLMLSSVAVVLAVRGVLPASAVAILVGRDAPALIGSLTVGSRVGVKSGVLYVGKVSDLFGREDAR